MSDRTVAEWQVPAVGSPTARELGLLREWGATAARAVALSLSGLGACPLTCSLQSAGVIDEGGASSVPDAVMLQWGAPGPQWQLRLTTAAAEDLLAGLLGCPGLQRREGWSRTDRDLLALQASELAQRVTADLRLPSSSAHGVRLSPEVSPLPAALLIDLELQLRIHDRAHELRLLTPFAEARQYLEGTARPQRPITAETVARAVLDLEAVLPGPQLSAGDLLQLRPGDVLCLGSVQQEAVVRAQGVAVARGRAGARSGKLAVSLREVSDPPQAQRPGR